MAQENNIGRLLPISENNGIQAVSGRYLHSFLQSKQDFSTWIKNRYWASACESGCLSIENLRL